MPASLGSLRSDPLASNNEIRRLVGEGASLDQIDREVIACGGLDEEHAAALWLYADQLTTAPTLAAGVRPPLYQD